MTDTAYKQTVVRGLFRAASSLKLSYPSELLRPPAQVMGLSQDSMGGALRVLASRHTGGSQEFLVDSVATGGATQGKPDSTTWRRVVRTRVEQQAGTQLDVRGIAVPSGSSEYMGVGTWPNFGVAGETRVVITWDNVDGDQATQTVSRSIVGEDTLDGGGDPDGAEKTDAGAAWAQLRHFVVTAIRPPDAPSEIATARKWSEGPSALLEVSDRGGARIIHMSVAESPSQHVADHDETPVTFGDQPNTWETNRPQVAAPDGATYEELRGGVHRTMNVAARQSERMGPVVAHWSAYDEAAAGVTDTDPTPHTTTSGTLARISVGTGAVWDAAEVAFDIVGTQRAPEHLSTRISGAGSIPVRIRIEAKYASAGSGVGKARFATSTRGYVDVDLDRAVIGTTWTEVEATGWLEANTATDDGYAKLQDFFASTGGIVLSVRSWSISYGEISVGA